MMLFSIRSVLFLGLVLILAALHLNLKDGHPVSNGIQTGATIDLQQDQTIVHFINLVTREDQKTLNQAISYIDKNWSEAYEIMLLETIYFVQRKEISKKLLHLLERKTKKNFDFDFDQWFHWIWNKRPAYTDVYFKFKAELHQHIDPKFYDYFHNRENESTIRLDEVRWGGVLQDGIPPLRNPKMASSGEANYLSDSDVVFGIAIDGDIRAYPKRILAWHEMFVDKVGNIPVAGVYCTLCGTVILYKTEYNGKNYELGTSGFLYRSNKLMYDKTTQSLWSTLEGQPVIGPLVEKGIVLDYLPVVTTTWGEWKKRHPETTVLSINTGHNRNYDEGVAYRAYFETDQLMFGVPTIDTRLKNKDQILAIRIPDQTDENLAISSKFLRKNMLFASPLGNTVITVFTDKTGAHRVYETKDLQFLSYDGSVRATDQNDQIWTLLENKITSEKGKELPRIATYNAFWFGYHAAFPDAKLIH